MSITQLIAQGVPLPEPTNKLKALTEQLNYNTAQRNFNEGGKKIETANKLAEYFGKTPRDSQNFIQGLYAIDPGAAQEFEKNQNDSFSRKASAAASTAQADAARVKLAIDRDAAYRKTMGGLLQDPGLTKEKAVAAVRQQLAQGVITPELAGSAIAEMSEDPAQLRDYLSQGLRAQLTPEQQITLFVPKPDKVDDGQTITTIDNNPLSPTFGQAVGGAPVQKQVSPDAQLTDTRARNEGALNRGVTVRGQDMTDTRTKEANQIARDTKSLTEGQAKSAMFGSRMTAANEIFNSLAATGATTSVPGSQSGYGIGKVVNALSSANQQQLDQAKRDFINAVLRWESGAVISDSEFANAEQQYFPQMGDSPTVIEQKKANRETAQRGVLIDVPGPRRDQIVSDITGGSKGPVSVTSKAQVDALPSGSQFIGPDGVVRVKP